MIKFVVHNPHFCSYGQIVAFEIDNTIKDGFIYDGYDNIVPVALIRRLKLQKFFKLNPSTYYINSDLVDEIKEIFLCCCSSDSPPDEWYYHDKKRSSEEDIRGL